MHTDAAPHLTTEALYLGLAIFAACTAAGLLFAYFALRAVWAQLRGHRVARTYTAAAGTMLSLLVPGYATAYALVEFGAGHGVPWGWLPPVVLVVAIAIVIRRARAAAAKPDAAGS